MCPSLIEIGSKTAEKNSAQTNRQTNKQTYRHYENNGGEPNISWHFDELYCASDICNVFFSSFNKRQMQMISVILAETCWLLKACIAIRHMIVMFLHYLRTHYVSRTCTPRTPSVLSAL